MSTYPLLSKSDFAEQHTSILMPIEAIISFFYDQHPDMHDHDVLRIYEAFIKL